MEPTLRLQLLGMFRLMRGERTLGEFESSKVRALLSYLVVEREKSHSRDALAGLLWPDAPDTVARKNLRQALTNLRKVIGDAHADPPYLEISRYQIRINPNAALWVDVVEYARLLEAVEAHSHRDMARCTICAEHLQRAVDLYQGEFLTGLYVGESALFDEWMMLTRERLHRQAIRSLELLVKYYEKCGRLDDALRCSNRLLELEPWSEKLYAIQMHLHALRGNRSAALKAYQRCQEVLMEEFGVEPLPETQQLWQQIRHGKYAVETSTPPPSNIPPALTPLVGRKDELSALIGRLLNPQCRLITLTGPGGVGKTRLALETGRRMRHALPDGVFWVSLMEVEPGGELPFAVAHAVQYPLRGTKPPESELAAYLQGKEMLLILDNFEHLLTETPLLVTWMRAAPQSAFLVTSRQPLGLQAEEVFSLSGLPYPQGDSRDVARNDAVRLFVSSARRAKSDVTLDEKSISTVAHICKMVEGLPLAIELAAAWMRHIPPQEIVTRMQEGLGALAVAWPDVPPRHRSLHAAFDQSWQLLSAEEQRSFARLAVFRGGFSAQAAEQVAGVSLPRLTDLVDASLVQFSPEGRYSFHALIHQFADEKLDSQRSALRQQHARYYANFVSHRAEDILSPRQVEVFGEITREWGNIRAAWNWCVEQRDVTLLDKMLHPLFHFIDGRSYIAEGLELFTRAVDELAGAEEALSLYWRLQTRRSVWVSQTGDLETAASLLRQGREYFRSQGDQREEAFAVHQLGRVVYLQGDFPNAQQTMEQALTMYQTQEDAFGISVTLNALALILCLQGEYQRAHDLVQESLAIYQEFGDPWGLGVRYNNQGIITQRLGDYAQAEQSYTQAMACWEELGHTLGFASVHTNLGLLLETRGEYQDAVKHYEEALRLFRRLNNYFGCATILNNRGNVAARQKEYALARSYYEECLELREKLGDQRGLISVTNNLGRIAVWQGDFTEARRHLRRVLEDGPRYNVLPLTLSALGWMSEMMASEGNVAQAVGFLTYVSAHPAATPETREDARKLIEAISTPLSAEELAAAREALSGLSFEQVCQMALEVAG
ncbi:MAG: tetratricopeptide repeat protein [Anaerolineae bacterium]|nr:MAG: tetratricopeptide repeat protein [Anaerolineae bacterium]